MAYNELEQRGTADFPVAFFYIDKSHPRYNMKAHWHTELEIIRILSGEFEITLNNTCYTAKKGDVIFINSETVHHGIPKDCVYECIVFHINFLYNETKACKDFMEQIANRDYIVNEFYNGNNPEFTECVNEIFDAFEVKSAGYKFRVISAFYKFMGIIADKKLYSFNEESKELLYGKNILKIKKILSYIRENFDKPITLEDMAKMAEMSVKYFGTYFKNMTGKTPFDYLNEYRIEKAARKLLNTDLSVTEIAYTCGFNDLSYFIKTFKRINKTSPGKYRKS